MDEQEIIESGILELYVSGALPDAEILETEKAIADSPTIRREVEVIESSLITLAENVAPPLSSQVWTYILNAIGNVKTLGDTDGSKFNWSSVTGWAAAILLLGGLLWMLNQNNDLKDKIDLTTTENTMLEDELINTQSELAEAEDILTIVRDKNYNAIPLPGNPAVAPDAYAKIYYNKEENIAYVDAKELPTPPQGKVYQVWSLVMEPLTPSSMGLLNTLTATAEGLYKFENFPLAEGFGITLEPEGGSETPTMSQLYTLGTLPTP